MTAPYKITPQLWEVRPFWDQQRFQEVKDLYRKNRVPFTMQYDNRLLTDWSNTPAIQELVRQEHQRIQDIVGQRIEPQVAYVSIDLPGSSIMMHRLHPDIFVQVQITMSDTTDGRMSFGYCNDREINEKSELDYQPMRRITRHDVDVAHYEPNTAAVYLSEPRTFSGSLTPVPPNTVREVVILSYTRAY